MFERQVPVAAQVLYSNGPILGGNNNAVEFVGDLAVSDTFTLSGNSKMTGFDFGVWVLQGDTPLTVDWSITSKAQGGKSYASGVANLTNVFHNSWTEGHDAYTWNIYDSFATANVSLSTSTCSVKPHQRSKQRAIRNVLGHQQGPRLWRFRRQRRELSLPCLLQSGGGIRFRGLQHQWRPTDA